jgi:hypothetical protein
MPEGAPDEIRIFSDGVVIGLRMDTGTFQEDLMDSVTLKEEPVVESLEDVISRDPSQGKNPDLLRPKSERPNLDVRQVPGEPQSGYGTICGRCNGHCRASAHVIQRNETVLKNME